MFSQTDNSNLLLTHKHLLLLVKNKKNEHKGIRVKTRNLELLSSRGCLVI